MDQPKSLCPYVAGNSIALRLKTPHNEAQVDAKIVRIFEPFTLSCVMVVRIDCPALDLDGNDDIVLKVFDRRFAKQARDNYKMQPWSLELEKDYNHFISCEGGLEFANALPSGTEEPPRTQDDLWNPSHEEAYLQFYLLGLYEAEKEAYQTLHDSQGKDVPRLIADVFISGGDTDFPQPHSQEFPGILLQHIKGFPLTDITDHAPKELWQSICDDAIRIINLMGDKGILNEDVNTRSFIVDLDPEETLGFKVTMIDLALCSFRREYEDEQEWTESKAIEEEEEEAIGIVMQHKLGGGFVYHRSVRYKKPASYYEDGEGLE
ncbi:hypothetical protein N7456_006323 [Penicillium angulare]|uniref:Protein kinase domain-containing protein n=1 Tax=Penicillium angulare TaxID=116970 RepID=A0A9W9FHG9_9EURO|nr:hypothetical protein N7456_006323 [Penicillium angulare]